MQKIILKLTEITPRFLSSLTLLWLTLYWIYSKAEYIYCERMWPDEALYVWYGLKIIFDPLFLFSREIVQFHPPLFSLFLAIAQWFSPSTAACQTLSFLFSMGGIWGVYQLGSQCFNRFVGLLAAIILAGNPIYAQYSTKILIDAPQMLFFVFLAMALFRATQDDRKQVDVLVGFLGAAIVWMKWSGVVVVFLIISVYILLNFRRNDQRGINRFKRLLIPLSILSGALLIFWLQTGGLFHYGHSLRSHHTQQSTWFYLICLPEIIGAYWLLPFLLNGFIRAFKNRGWGANILLLWLIVVFLSITVVAEKTLRFAMLILPPILLLTASGIEGFLGFLIRKPRNLWVGQTMVIGLLVIFLVQATQKINSDLGEENKFYKGFTEIGDWIRKNAPPGSVIMATSPRNIQYSARLNMQGRDYTLINFPKERKVFESMLGKQQGPVILQIDNWGDPGQFRFNPLNNKDLNYFENLGFSIKKAGGRLRYRKSNQVYVIAPACWVLERNGLP